MTKITHRVLRDRVSTLMLVASLCGGAWGAACSSPSEDDAPERPLAGGDTTILDRTALAYSRPAPTLTETELSTHREGDVGFSAKFVVGPAPVHAGLGPRYNNDGCLSCHMADGRGLPVMGRGLLGSSMLLRASAASGTPDPHGGPTPAPTLGGQLQDHAIFGVEPEVLVELTWNEHQEAYADGTTVSLQRPIFTVTRPDGTALPSDVVLSPRLAPPVFGLGLLEAIVDEDILAREDTSDRDGDGISGRANHVWSVQHGATVLGRLGWKANTPDLKQQAAAAYANDMGVTTPLFLEAAQAPEVDANTLDAVTFYTQTLAVPSRVGWDNDLVTHGQALFRTQGCMSCHVEDQKTGQHAVSALSRQMFHPYTDLLLHDMGEELADGRSDFLASGTEWRTPPLWGIGIAQTVLQEACFLHDGRARTLEEAILWHGGEATRSREAFRNAPQGERQALIAFLQSL